MTRSITGLPEQLGAACHLYLDAFPAGDVVAFPIDGIDRVGIPVWVVALFPETADLDGIMPYGVGYGATDEAAILGALGEIAEMVWPTLTLSARGKTQGSYAELVRERGMRGIADPLTLCLPAGSPVDRDTPLDWVEARRWADGSSVLVPIDLAAYSAKELEPGYVPFTTIISNGMGAGPDLDWAIGHGLCEILQRDGNGLLFRALDRGVAIDLPESLPGEIGDLINRFAAAGIRVIPKFATDEFGMANVYCVAMIGTAGRQSRAQSVRTRADGARQVDRPARVCRPVHDAGRRCRQIERRSRFLRDAALDRCRCRNAARMAGRHDAGRAQP
jgi:ribosomal protein S12 methylthiotransferase accessory factor